MAHITQLNALYWINVAECIAYSLVLSHSWKIQGIIDCTMKKSFIPFLLADLINVSTSMPFRAKCRVLPLVLYDVADTIARYWSS